MEKKAKKILKENGQDYCRNTTLHGFSYWVLEGTSNPSTSLALRLSPSSESSIIDKIFWVVIVLAMIIWGVEMVTEAFIDWANDPTRKCRFDPTQPFVAEQQFQRSQSRASLTLPPN